MIKILKLHYVKSLNQKNLSKINFNFCIQLFPKLIINKYKINNINNIIQEKKLQMIEKLWSYQFKKKII